MALDASTLLYVHAAKSLHGKMGVSASKSLGDIIAYGATEIATRSVQWCAVKEVISRNRDIVLVLLAFIGLALAYSVVNPLHEATDELRHYRFVRFIAAEKRLPVQGQEACRTQSHHPPLYYGLGALATGWIETGRDICYTPPHNPFWAYRYADVGVDNKNQYLHGPDEAFPWQGEALAAHILRAINVLFGAGTVWLTWAVGRAIWPRRRALAAGGAAFVAFNPMFLYMSGAVNNDVIAAFSGAAVLLACVRLLRDEQGLRPRWGVIMGALYGLALMSKFNMAVVALLIAAAMTYVAWRRRQWDAWWRAALSAALTTLIVAGWWFLRNQMLYGEPTGFRAVTELWGARDPRESLPLALLELPLAWSTLWGRFGFGQIPLPEIVYDGLAWVTGAGLLGALLGAVRDRGEARPIFLIVPALNVLLAFAVLFNYMLVSPAGAMGRFFFPGLPALALLTFFGLTELVLSLQRLSPSGRRKEREDEPIEQRVRGLLALGTNGSMLALAVVALFAYLAPAYARPPSYPEDMALPNSTGITFSGLATLRGYALSTQTLEPGQRLDVDLYWEVDAPPPGNFLLFLHLIDSTGAIVAQRDTHPGTGTFPTAQWQAGDQFVDSLSVYVPETAYTPETLTVSVGFYAPTYRLAVIGAEGEALGDSLTLGTVALQPRSGEGGAGESVPNPTMQNFQNELFLRGYEYDRRLLQPGDSLEVVTYWEAIEAPERQYVAQVQALEGSGAVRAQAAQALAPQTWQGAGLHRETIVLALPENLEPGPYVIRMILFDPERDEAHHLVAPQGHFTGEHLDLARVVIR